MTRIREEEECAHKGLVSTIHYCDVLLVQCIRCGVWVSRPGGSWASDGRTYRDGHRTPVVDNQERRPDRGPRWRACGGTGQLWSTHDTSRRTVPQTRRTSDCCSTINHIMFYILIMYYVLIRVARNGWISVTSFMLLIGCHEGQK